MVRVAIAAGFTILAAIWSGQNASAQDNAYPDDNAATAALWAKNVFGSPEGKDKYSVKIEKCGPAEKSGGAVPFPTPPGAVVCTVSVKNGDAPARGHIALFFFAADKWNGQLLM